MEKLLEKQTLMMSTLGEGQIPAISYAPFVKIEDKVYIYISKAANHYHNLLNNPHAAIMMIEDEAEAKVQFARCRLSFNCIATKLDVVNEEAWTMFNERFDEKMMVSLSNLDFDMFELQIKDGRLVKGFGQAFDITIHEGKMKLEQVTGMGHGENKK